MTYKIGITSIFVTHDQDEAVEVADEIIITNNGKVEQMGPPIEIYHNPSTPFVAQFIGQSQIVEDYWKISGFNKKDSYSKAIIRPEFIKVYKQDESKKDNKYLLEGMVTDVAFRGNTSELTVKAGDMIFRADRSFEKSDIFVGEKVNLLIYRMYVYDENSVYMIKNDIAVNQD